MITFIKNMLGIGPSVNFAELVKNGAIIIDVRTQGEYQGGNIKGSINIPLDSLRNNLSKFSKEKTIITCCASGMRSSSAKGILKSSGYTTVHNGGGWMSLQNRIR